MANFFKERNIIKQRIAMLKDELELHRQTLNGFEKMKYHLSDDTSDEVLRLIDETILDHTASVQKLELEIRLETRLLKTKYSLAPAIK